MHLPNETSVTTLNAVTVNVWLWLEIILNKPRRLLYAQKPASALSFGRHIRHQSGIDIAEMHPPGGRRRKAAFPTSASGRNSSITEYIKHSSQFLNLSRLLQNSRGAKIIIFTDMPSAGMIDRIYQEDSHN